MDRFEIRKFIRIVGDIIQLLFLFPSQVEKYVLEVSNLFERDFEMILNDLTGKIDFLDWFLKLCNEENVLANNLLLLLLLYVVC